MATGRLPSIDLRILEILAPQMRPGALLADDNGEPDVLDYLRTPANGFRSTPVPLTSGSFEIAVRT